MTTTDEPKSENLATKANIPTTHQPPLQAEHLLSVEVDSNDDDSFYESGIESTTTSLASSIYKYEYENGRRYHAFNAGTYVLPNDETEQDRLDMMHHVYLLLLGGKLHTAPLKNPQRVLDVGTGTGIWAIDFADMYDSAQVIGTDLSPIQPSWVPPNIQFLVDDAEAPWMFAKDSFDYIHVRGLVGAILDWPKFLGQCFEHLRPGGYLELVEVEVMDLFSDDGTYHDQTALWRYYSLLNESSRRAGRLITMDKHFHELLPAAGFDNIKVDPRKLPLGSWPANAKLKELGRWFGLVAESGFEAYGLALMTRAMGMKIDDVKSLIEDVKVEYRSRKVHGYVYVDHYVGQRPVET